MTESEISRIGIELGEELSRQIDFMDTNIASTNNSEAHQLAQEAIEYILKNTHSISPEDLGKIFINVGIACWAAAVFHQRYPKEKPHD